MMSHKKSERRGRPSEQEQVARTKYILDYGNIIYHFDHSKNKNGAYLVEIIDHKYDKAEKLFEKLERLQKPTYHENGRKKRITKVDKAKMESTEKAYWTEHYKLFPEDRPKKRGRKKKGTNE
jgi:uncharacterized protein YicC (UPF0701 family)